MKEFSEESKSEIIHRIFEMCREGKVTIVTSRWTINESIAALDKKYKKGEITIFDRDQVIFTILRRVDELIVRNQIFATRLTNEVLQSSTIIITDKHLSADEVLADNRFASLAKDGEDFEIFNILNGNDYGLLEEFLVNIK